VDGIRAAFGDILGGILSIVAQNLVLELEAMNGATITSVHHEKAVPIQLNKKYRVPFADLFGEEQRDVLVSITMPPALDGDHALISPLPPPPTILQATLQYIDVIAARSETKITSIGATRSFSSKELYNRELNPKIGLQSTRLRVVNAIESARSMANSGKLEEARNIIEKEKHAVKVAFDKFNGTTVESSKLLAVFEQDLTSSSESLKDNLSYHKGGSSRMMRLAEGHMQQRSMESETDDHDHSLLRKSAYRTASQGKFATKFSGYRSS
jgi:hypothetical protein